MGPQALKGQRLGRGRVTVLSDRDLRMESFVPPRDRDVADPQVEVYMRNGTLFLLLMAKLLNKRAHSQSLSRALSVSASTRGAGPHCVVHAGS